MSEMTLATTFKLAAQYCAENRPRDVQQIGDLVDRLGYLE